MIDPAWWIFPVSVLGSGLFFGLFPGLILRAVVQFYPPGHPRREELFGELYHSGMGRLERYEWVFQQFETALREGPVLRKRARQERQIDGQTDEPNEEDESNEEFDVVEVDTEGVSSQLPDDHPIFQTQMLSHGLDPEDSYIDLPDGTKLTAAELAADPRKRVLIVGDPGQGKSALFRGNSSFRLDSPRHAAEGRDET